MIVSVSAPSRPQRSRCLVLSVEFAAPGGRTWEAIGGGDTFEAAADFARESCPADTTWRLVRWNDLYGD